MTDKMNIKDELLKQMDTSPDKASTLRILARDASRVKRMKWITIITWLIVALCFALGGLLELVAKKGLCYLTEGEEVLMTSALAMSHIFSIFAICFTISYYIRSRNLTIRQIQMRLAGIEEQLRKMAQDKTAAPGA